MTSPQDRILELALEEVVGRRRPPDLAERILARARRPLRRLPLRRLAWAAAALLLVALGVWAALPQRSDPEPEPPAAAELTADEQAEADRWIALQRETIVVDLADPAGLERLKAQWLARRELLDLLDDKPAGWAWVRPRLLPLPAGPEEREVRGRLIEILGRAPGAEDDPLILDRIRRGSFEVDVGLLLVLAERDSAPARALLEQRVESLPPVTPLALPAAYLALRGDARGQVALERLLESPKSQEAMPAVALASAAGLHRLGDPAPWAEARATQLRLAEDRLADGNLDGARLIVAAFTLVQPAVTEQATIRLGDLGRHAERLARGLGGELPTADAIRARLAELTD